VGGILTIINDFKLYLNKKIKTYYFVKNIFQKCRVGKATTKVKAAINVAAGEMNLQAAVAKRPIAVTFVATWVEFYHNALVNG
jgi:hypothetical protein